MFRSPLIHLIMFLVVLSCSKESPHPDNSRDEESSGVAPTEDGMPKQKKPVLSAANSTTAGDKVAAKLSLQLFLAGAAELQEAIPLTFSYVAPIFQKCVACHSGQQSPNLSQFPFVSASGDSLSKILAKVQQRMNDAQRPMPLSGLLSIGERSTVSSWIGSGALATLPTPPASDAMRPYSLDVKWLVNGKVFRDHVEGSSSGSFVQPLGLLPVGTSLSVIATLVGPEGVVVTTHTYSSLIVPSSGDVPLALKALPILGSPAALPVASMAPEHTAAAGTNEPDATAAPLRAAAEPSNTPQPTPLPQIDAFLSLQLILARAADPVPPLTYVDINPILQACLTCHGTAGQSPNLGTFPFTSSTEEPLAAIIAKIRQRTNDLEMPMPPRGLLADAERRALRDWIDAGYPATLPPPNESSESSLYAVDVTWRVHDEITTTHFDGTTSGTFTLTLGSQQVGTALTVNVKVTGPRNIVVLDKTFSGLGLPASGVIQIPVTANAVDVLAPVPGARGEITSTNISHNSVSLKWTNALDAETPPEGLIYSIYQATTDSLDTLDHVKSTGTLLAASLHGQGSSFLASDLAPNTRYFFNILVQDSAGNEAIYAAKSFKTADDPNELIVSEYPNCISVAQPTRARIAAWRDAAAQDLQSGASETAVASRIRQCFPSGAPSCVQPTLDYANRDDTAAAGNDTSYANAPERQPPAAFLSPSASGFEYIIPSDVEQIAEANGWPVVRYKSRHAGGFDSQTPNLLMVYVPGDRVNPPVDYDRWLNFSTPQDTAATALTPLPQMRLAEEGDYDQAHQFGQGLPRVFTMVSLKRASASKPGEVFFQMFDRESSGPKFTPRSNSSVKSCVSCHPNGLRAISPLGLHVRSGEDQLPERDWRAAEAINQAMVTAAGGKTVSWRSAVVGGVRKPFLNPASQGPILGPMVPLNEAGTRTKDFIMGGTNANGSTFAGCYNKRTTVRVVDIFSRAPGLNNIYKLAQVPHIRWEKVRDAMQCASCHNDVQRGAINDSVDMSQVDFKILVDQSMPLGAHVNPLDLEGSTPNTPVRDDLTGDERIALANCLAAEFSLEKLQLKKWLTQTTCQ